MHPNVRSVSGAVLLVLAALAGSASPDEAADPARRDQVLRAVGRGLEIVQKGARSYPSHRECFACHHQTLPLLGMTQAAAASVSIDKELPSTMVKFARKSFGDQIESLRDGKGIGGRGLTVGYGLWTFRIAGSKPDELTEAMVTYLLKTQEDDGHWGLHAIRPPAEESLVMCTALAAAGVKRFAAPTQREPATAALNKARAWLATATLPAHEDRVARLWGLHSLGGDTDEQLAGSRQAVLETQAPDGGWSQMSDMASDAYATGTALNVLLETRSSRPQSGEATEEIFDRAVARAIGWLVQTQLPDGSWHVQTRAKPVQVFFDNGDPHGADQFISMAATGWATAALAASLARDTGPAGQGR